jgi:hypothetical protein
MAMLIDTLAFFQGYAPLVAHDENPFKHSRDEEDRHENQQDWTCRLAEQFVKTDIEFHLLRSGSPLCRALR